MKIYRDAICACNIIENIIIIDYQKRGLRENTSNARKPLSMIALQIAMKQSATIPTFKDRSRVLVNDFHRTLGELEKKRERESKRDRESNISRVINISVKDVGGRSHPLRRSGGFIESAGRKDSFFLLALLPGGGILRAAPWYYLGKIDYSRNRRDYLRGNLIISRSGIH